MQNNEESFPGGETLYHCENKEPEKRIMPESTLNMFVIIRSMPVIVFQKSAVYTKLKAAIPESGVPLCNGYMFICKSIFPFTFKQVVTILCTKIVLNCAIVQRNLFTVFISD